MTMSPEPMDKLDAAAYPTLTHSRSGYRSHEPPAASS